MPFIQSFIGKVYMLQCLLKIIGVSSSFIKKFLKFLKKDTLSFKLPINNLTKKKSVSIERILFGGCFSVFSALIGTPYFPNL